jgi:magnesium chelatase family protein
MFSSAPVGVEVKGQEHVEQAIEVAAAGAHNLLDAHNLLLAGPSGGGKTVLGRRIPGILPRLARDQALGVTALHSVPGRARLHRSRERLVSFVHSHRRPGSLLTRSARL